MNRLNLKRLMATFAFGMCLLTTFAIASAPRKPRPVGPSTDPIKKGCPEPPCPLK